MNVLRHTYTFTPDPRYPVAIRDTGGEGLRLSATVEQQLIEDAARGGAVFKVIRNQDDYLRALVFAAGSEKEARSQDRAAEKLLVLIEAVRHA